MIEQGPGPSMQDGQHRQASADVMGIPGQLLQGGRRTVEQQTVEGLLLAVAQGTQSCGQREGQQIIGAGQESSPLLLQPTVGLFCVTLRTMPVAAGMIAVMLLPTVIPPIELAATGRGATAHQVHEHLLLTGQKPVGLPIGRAVEAEDVCHLDHERGGLQSVHQLIDRRLD